MVNCAIGNCRNYSRKTKGTAVRYFRFPKQNDMIEQWIIACQRRDKINVKNAFVCSVHFTPECYEIPLRQRLLNYRTANTRILKGEAVPSLKLPPTRALDRNERSERLTEIRIKQEVIEIPSYQPANEPEIEEYDENIHIDSAEVIIQKYAAKIKELENKVASLQRENRLLLKLKKTCGER